MQITKRGEPLAINQALNKPREKLGLSLPIWMFIVIVSILVLLLRFYLLSIAIFIVITAGCWFIVRKHPKMFQLWGLSFTQKSYYDPRKR
ncbi:type IV secretory pathway VirB3 [Granulicella sibirica]|uniref:Type IV secretory pathway VirB3 n=1 Tax=Granulicella sibirica TaxID=2479048 RepID=A0A4Q0SYF5_9BACT|nr:type IV secretory pathway VirB3 [Granulicella sibirica]